MGESGHSSAAATALPWIASVSLAPPSERLSGMNGSSGPPVARVARVAR